MVLVNLKPAKLAGVLSEGMLLCAEDADGNLALMTPEKEYAGRSRNLLRTVYEVTLNGKEEPSNREIDRRGGSFIVWNVCKSVR